MLLLLLFFYNYHCSSYYHCYHYVLINVIGLHKKVQWHDLGVVAKLWLLDCNYCQNNKGQWKNLSALLRVLDIITAHALFSFIYLFIFSANKFLLTTVYNFYNLSLLKLFFHAEAVHQRCSPGGVVLQMCCKFLGACLCMGVISITLQSSFVEIILLHCCSPVDLLCICRNSFLDNTSGGLLLNKDNFIYNF